MTWLFARANERLTLTRVSERELVMEGADGIERFEFTSRDDLLAFHVRLEEHLRNQGWTLVEFSPERRAGPADRRGVRRSGIDRRKIGKRDRST